MNPPTFSPPYYVREVDGSVLSTELDQRLVSLCTQSQNIFRREKSIRLNVLMSRDFIYLGF